MCVLHLICPFTLSTLLLELVIHGLMISTQIRNANTYQRNESHPEEDAGMGNTRQPCTSSETTLGNVQPSWRVLGLFFASC